MRNGFFGSMFDFDRDGELNPMERAMDFFAFNEMTRKDKTNYEEGEDELEDDLIMTGLDYYELCDMDEDERNEMLEDAGLDPDDYDF